MYEDIKQQFREVIEYSQCISNPQVDKLFERWEQNKEKFIKRFGGLIYEHPEPVEFLLDPYEKRHKAMEFIDCVSETFNNASLADFLDENLDSFYENKVSNSCGHAIPEGMKLIKAFKFFESNKKALRDMQDIASQLIQENKIKGTLCFSVHPLDFLSSSENTYNWRSCHALDGEYRAGNLSYMADNCTFMVYLKGAEKVNLPSFGPLVQWNSKKWRMLIYAAENDEIMFAGRQYPFSSRTGIDTVLNIYNNLFQNSQREYPFSYPSSKYHYWSDDYIDKYSPKSILEDTTEPIYLDEKYLIISNHLIALPTIIRQNYNALNYNDVLQSTCYTHPYYTVLNPWGYHDIKQLSENPIRVGEEIPCLLCGQELIVHPETMRCDDCESKYGYEENDTWGSCSNCGRRIYVDDAPSVGIYDELVCDECYENHCFICDNCGEAHYNENRHFVSTPLMGDLYVCGHCNRFIKNKLEEIGGVEF